jgi:hypothetical protein
MSKRLSGYCLRQLPGSMENSGEERDYAYITFDDANILAASGMSRVNHKPSQAIIRGE